MFALSIKTILFFQLWVILLIACVIFLETIFVGEKAVEAGIRHGEDAVATCFDDYVTTIKTTGESFVKDISALVKNHVVRVVDAAEVSVRSTAKAAERVGYMEVMENNGWHGSQLLPTFGWMILNQLADNNEDVVGDFVMASLNSTEEYNNWVWYGVAARNPNTQLACEFYYYRNATNTSGSVWCLDDLWEDPNQLSPSVWPHKHSPAIVKLQEAVPREPYQHKNGIPRPIKWMPLNFFASTYNLVALTSVVTGIYGPEGSIQGLAAANVRFSTVSEFLASVVESSRYSDLNAMLVETQSEQILATSIGSAIYFENQTRADGVTMEYEVAANMSQIDNQLAEAIHEYIREEYGSVQLIPTPLITTATIEDQKYFLSFDTFARPLLNLTMIAFLPVQSVTGPAEIQRQEAQFDLDESVEELEDKVALSLLIQIVLAGAGLLACAIIASVTAMYIASRIQAFVGFMQKICLQISSMADSEDTAHDSTTEGLCALLSTDFFPTFGYTHLKDLNKIRDSTEELCSQLEVTWNTKQEAFRQALEQRQFTASIAHDIRNPLHGILGIINLLRENVEDHKDKLPLLEETVIHMATLLNDMVDLSKIQGGKVSHAFASFDVWNILYDVVSIFQDTVAAGGGTLCCSERTSLPRAYSDPVHVKRIVSNFVSNAAKYAVGSKIRLQAVMATRQHLQDLTFLKLVERPFKDNAPYSTQYATLKYEEYIVVVCADEGRGIPSTNLESIFGAYQQTRESDRNQGAGLGLAIVRGLAADLGGSIGVQSQVDLGTIFWLAIPCSHASGEEPLDKTPTSGVKQDQSLLLASPAIESYRVLVIDDVKLNLMLMKSFLERLGIESVILSSALAGLSLLRQEPNKFHLVLSDYNMPEMNGGEFCLELRSDPRLRHLPFICTSGSALPRNVTEKFQMDETLTKPFTVDKIKETLEAYLGHCSRWSQSLKSESINNSNLSIKVGDRNPSDSATEELTDSIDSTKLSPQHDAGAAYDSEMHINQDRATK